LRFIKECDDPPFMVDSIQDFHQEVDVSEILSKAAECGNKDIFDIVRKEWPPAEQLIKQNDREFWCETIGDAVFGGNKEMIEHLFKVMDENSGLKDKIHFDQDDVNKILLTFSSWIKKADTSPKQFLEAFKALREGLAGYVDPSLLPKITPHKPENLDRSILDFDLAVAEKLRDVVAFGGTNKATHNVMIGVFRQYSLEWSPATQAQSNPPASTASNLFVDGAEIPDDVVTVMINKILSHTPQRKYAVPSTATEPQFAGQVANNQQLKPETMRE
jgi:hypothetical protein